MASRDSRPSQLTSSAVSVLRPYRSSLSELAGVGRNSDISVYRLYSCDLFQHRPVHEHLPYNHGEVLVFHMAIPGPTRKIDLQYPQFTP